MAQVDWSQFTPVDTAANTAVDWSKFTLVDAEPASAVDSGDIDFDTFVTRIEGRESGGNPNAVSPQGAKGAMQVMPDTFKDYAQPGESFDNENDRRAVALRKLRADWDFYGGDPMRVAAAYIGGRGAVREDGSIREDVADAHGTTPLAYAQQVVLGRRDKDPASNQMVDVSKYGAGYFSSAIAKPAKEQEPDIVASAGRGAARGLADMASAVGSGVQFIGERLGAKGMADYGKRVADAWGEIGQQFDPHKSIQGAILDDPKLLTKGAWWAYNIANIVPSFAASVVPGVAAGRGIQVLGQTMKWTPEVVSRLAWLGGSIVGGAAGGSLEGAQTYQEVQKRGGSESEAAAAGTQMALASAALNAISLGNLTAKAKNVVTKFLKTGVWEGLTEWAEEPAEGAILSRTSVAKPEDDPMLRAREGANVFPVAAVTGGIGGAMSGTRTPKPEAQPGPLGGQQIPDVGAQSEMGKTPESIEAAAVQQSGAAPGVVSTEPIAATRIPEIEAELSAIAEQLQGAGVDPQSEIAQRMQSRVAALEDERARLAGTAEPSQTIQYQPPAAPTEAEQTARHLADTERQFRDNQIAQDVSQSAVPYERVTPPAVSAPAPATEPAAQPAGLPDRLELVPIDRDASAASQQYDFSSLKAFNTPQSAALSAARALQETGQRHDIVAHPTQADALAVVPSGSGMAAAVARVAAPSGAQQDAARMGRIEELAVDDSGSLALPENEPIMRAFLQSLPAAEAATMIDAQGRVSQIGMRRFQHAVLARAYGANPVIQKLISGKTAFAQRLSASLTKMAPMVSAIKDAVQQQAVADRDITDTIVGAVDELVRMKAEGRKPGQVLAQSGLFQDVAPETAALVEFIDENMNAPERMNAFLRAYLEELQRYGSDQQGQLFSAPAVPQGADLIDAARSRMDGQPQFQQPPAKEPGNVEGGEVSQVEGAPSEGGLQERAGEAAGNADATAASVGTADAAEVSGAPQTGQQRGDGPVDGADVGRGAGEGESDAVAEQDAPAAASDQVEKAEVPTETQEQDAAAKIAEASRDAAHSPENDKPLPSRAQIEAGNYSLGHVRLFGLDISIENPKGSTRTGIDPGGQPWQVKMVAAYGYLKKTTARDGDHVDVYLTGNPTEQTPVFVVDQIDPKTGRFDEHKVVLGAATRAEAEALYDAHFSDRSGPQRRGAVRQWTLERFKTWLKTGNTKRPVAYKEPKVETKQVRAETKPAQTETPAASRETIQDVGEKIGGARKDLWRDRGLSVDDLSGMSGGEQSQFATKDNVWPKIDYAKRIADGMEPKAAALLKQIRDGIAAKPRKDDVDGRRRYVETLGMLRDMAADARTVDDVKALSNKLTTALGVQAGTTSLEGRAALERLWSIYRGRTNPVRIGWDDERRADRLLKEGWPTPVRGQRESKGKDAGETPDRPYLDELQRTGEDLRGGRNVTGEEVKDAFGFRGIEYGNYAAQDERQRLLNLAFDGLHDLASLLGVPPKAVSFNGTLGIAFGARGGGNFAAHYEPGKLVINMTKLRGGGSLAHEWAHALDHYFGELDRPDAYQGKARGATGWYTRGYAKHENLRPEMAAAFDRVMAAIYYKPGTRSQSSYVTQAGKLSGKSGSSGYWARPTELFARAFESYVFDKIASDDRVSQYLVQGVEADRFESDRYKGNPYPTGDERKAINDAFDALVGALQTKETDRGVAMFSRARASSLRSLGIPAAADPPLSAVASVGAMQSHPDYRAAKAGDVDAAARLVSALVPQSSIETAGERFGADVVYAFAHAFEASGENAIPAVLAYAYAKGTGANVDDNIVQSNRVFHTGANAMQRLISRPTFDGPVQAGKQYVLVDDVITLGGTLAELAAHIQAGGGQVVGVVTLVNAGRSARMTPPARFISELERRLGDVIREEFGVDPAALTASEAQYLIGFRNADELRNRAASAKREKADRLRARGIEESPIREEGGVSDPPLSITEAPERGLSAFGEVPGAAGRRARVVAELTERLGRAPDESVVSILDNWRDLPEERREFIESRRAFDVQGMFDPRTGRVYLIADNLPPGAAFSVFLHEIGVHKGMREFIGAELLDGLVKQIRTWADLSMGEEGKIARTALARIPADTDASVRDEESVAYFVEEAVRRGHDIPQSRPEKRGLGQWLYDLWQAVRGALAKLRAEPTTLTAADVVALARGAAEQAMGRGEAQYTSSIAEPALSVATGRPATWDAPEASRLDDILYTLQDKHIDTRRVMQAITKHSGAAVADTIDPYLQEELFHGRAAKHVDDFLRTELKPLLADMTQRGVTMQDLEAYLHARHAEERNAQIAKVNPNMPDGGSGMTTKDARAYLAAIDPAKRRSFDALAKRVDAITAGTRSTLVANGLESPNAIKAWESAYKHYVPLYREDMEGSPGVGQGFSVKGPASKRAMGSSAAVTDIIANIAMQRERAIVRAEKNRVANALVGLAQANPNPDFWQVDRPPMIRYIDERTGLVTERVDPMFKSRDNVVTARLPDANGEIIERSVSFNETDERAMRMARALKNLDTDDLGLFLSASAKITRYLASINTQYNPVFGVVNITRDVQGALANLSSTPLAGKQSAVLGNTLSALRGIYRDLRDIRSGKQPSSQWAALFEEFQSEGGQTGYRDMFRTSKDRAEAIEKELRKVTEGKAKALGRAVFDWLSDYNNSMENAVRLAAYKVGVDAGMSKQRAASLAKNLTVNFNRKGQAATQVGALYAFFNASTQGTARLVETLRGPMGKRIIMGGLLAGVMQALLIAASDLGDDDDTLKDFVKERNLVIPIGDKQYLTIPMPLGLHVLPNIGRIGAEFALSGFKKPGERLVSLMGILAEAFNPIGSAGVSVQTIAPSAVDPFVALAENKDWGGRQIARKDFSSLNPTPGHTRAKDSSSWISRELSRALNWATGGTEYTPGLFSPTPDQIDYLVGQVAGGVGREALKVWETAETSYTGEDLPSYKVPLLGRFYGNADEPASHAGRFYDTLKEIHIHAAEIKGRRRDGEDVAGYIEEHPEARLIEAAKAAERRVSRLRKQRRELDQDDAGSEALRAIDDRINAEIRRFNDRVTSVRATAPAQ